MKKTATQRIYDFLKTRVGREFNHRVIVDSQPYGLGITEYTRPFVELREQFGCTCAKSPALCRASEHIINTRKNFYIYKSNAAVNEFQEPVKPVILTGQVKTTWEQMGAYLRGQAERPKTYQQVAREALL